MTSAQLVLRPVVRKLILYPKGRPGRDGSSAGGIPPISFAYGDATPDAIYTFTAPGTLTGARIAITTAFNGTGASMALGVTGDLSALLAADQVDVTSIGEFENTPDTHVSISDQVIVSITAGTGATQGAGRIYLQFTPD